MSDPPATVDAEKSQMSPKATPGPNKEKGRRTVWPWQGPRHSQPLLASSAGARSYATAQGKEKPTRNKAHNPKSGRVGPPAMARPTAGSGFGECLSSGFDPPFIRIPPGLSECRFFFAHQRTLEVGVSSLSAGVCGDAWSAWTFGEGLK